MAFAISIPSFFLCYASVLPPFFLRSSSASERRKSEERALSTTAHLDRRERFFFCVRCFYFKYLYCEFVLVLTTNNDSRRGCWYSLFFPHANKKTLLTTLTRRREGIEIISVPSRLFVYISKCPYGNRYQFLMTRIAIKQSGIKLRE